MIRKFTAFILAALMCFSMAGCGEKEPVTVREEINDGQYVIHEYPFEGSENRTRSTWYYSNGNIITDTTYEYDKNGNLVLVLTVDGNGSQDYRKENEYNENNILIKSTTYSEVFLNSVDEFDDNGNAIKSTLYDPFGNITGVTVFEYDKNNELAKVIFYDGRGNMESLMDYSNEGQMMRYSYMYDEEGNIIHFRINGEEQPLP